MKRTDLSVSKNLGLEAAMLCLEYLGWPRLKVAKYLRSICWKDKQFNGDTGQTADIEYCFEIESYGPLLVRVFFCLERTGEDGTDWKVFGARAYSRNFIEEGFCAWKLVQDPRTHDIVFAGTS